jgi:hypothetical protein
LYRTIDPFGRSVSGDANTTNVFNFAIDLERFFATAQDTIDFKVERQFHGSLNQLPLGIKMANNSSKSFKLLE